MEFGQSLKFISFPNITNLIYENLKIEKDKELKIDNILEFSLINVAKSNIEGFSNFYNNGMHYLMKKNFLTMGPMMNLHIESKILGMPLFFVHQAL